MGLDKGDIPHLAIDDLLLVQLVFQLGENIHQPVHEKKRVHRTLAVFSPALLLDTRHPLGSADHFQKVVQDAFRVSPGALFFIEQPQGKAAPISRLSALFQGGGAQFKPLLLAVVQKSIRHVRCGKHHQPACRVFHRLGFPEPLLLQFFIKAVLDQFKGFYIQNVSLHLLMRCRFLG